MLPKTVYTLPFTKGVNEKHDKYVLDPGELEQLVNGVFDKEGAINPRPGHDIVAAAGSLDVTKAAGFGVTNFGSTVIVSDGYHLYAQSDLSGLRDLGGTSQPMTIGMTQTISKQVCRNPSVDIFGQYTIITYETDSGVDIVIYQGGVRLWVQSIFGIVMPKVIGKVGGFFAYSNIDSKVHYYAINVGTGAITDTALSTCNGVFYAWVDSFHTPAQLLYYGSGRINYAQVNSVGSVTSSVAGPIISVNIPNTITGCTEPDGTVVAAWSQKVLSQSQIQYYSAVFSSVALLSDASRITVESAAAADLEGNISAIYASGAVHVYYDRPNKVITHLALNATNTVAASTSIFSRNLLLAGSPFLTGSVVSVPCLYQGTTKGIAKYLMLDGDAALSGKSQVLARFGEGAGSAPGLGRLSPPGGSGPFTLGLPMAASNGMAISLATMDIVPKPLFAVERGGALYALLGSRVFRWDGIGSIVEDNFDVYPDSITLPTATGSGAGAHSYGYLAHYSWMDSLGMEQKSSISGLFVMLTANPIGTGGGTETVTVTIPRFVLPTAKSGIQVKLFRTTDKGTDPFLLKTFDNSSEGGSDPLVISYIDSVPDNVVSAAAIIAPIITGTKVGERQLPAPTVMAIMGKSGGFLSASTTYRWRVTAVSKYGETELSANSLQFTTDSTNRSVQMVWDILPGATGYRVYRAVSPFTTWIQVSVGDVGAGNNQFFDAGIMFGFGLGPTVNTTASGGFSSGVSRIGPPTGASAASGSLDTVGKQAYYRVTATNANGESLASQEVSFGSAVRQIISWSAVAGATGYNIYRSIHDAGTPWCGDEHLLATGVTSPWTDTHPFSDTPSTTLVPTLDTTADTNATVQTNYYKVTAITGIGTLANGSGETDGSGEASVALNSNALNAGVQVSWSAVNGAIRYRLYRSTSAGAEKFLVETDQYSYLDTNTSTDASIAVPVVNTTKPPASNALGTADKVYTGSTSGGGQIANLPPPSTSFLTAHQNRIFGIDSDVPGRVWFSHRNAYGFPSEGNPLVFYVDLPAQGGPVIGLASLESVLVCFKARSIYIVGGPGPDPTGSGSFDLPFALPGEIGLKDPKSIVQAPQGLLFRSAKGIYSLSRDLSLQYIGSQVEDSLGSSTIVSALLAPTANEVRFYTSTGKILAYNWFAQQWGTSTISGVKAADVSPTTGVLTLALSDGSLLAENSLDSLDGNTAFGLTVRTNWIPVAQFGGLGLIRRIGLLGQILQGGTLTVSIDYDRVEGSPQTATIPITGDGKLDVQVDTRTHRAESIRITISAASPLVSLSALTFLVSPKSGLNRLPKTNKFGAQ